MRRFWVWMMLAPLLGGVEARRAPLVVIAVDGLRHDFPARYGMKRLLELKEGGAAVERLVPAFPSTTFPNFHTMATGLLPARHGIVAMVFRDPQTGRGFHYTRNATEGEWYGGEPFWLLAESQGVRAAAYFWPGTDAAIGGRRPWQYRKYDPSATHEQKIAQALEWLGAPESERPGVVVVYFADVDSAGHAHGPDSAEVRAACGRVDSSIGRLVEGARRLAPGTNFVVVSDHGQSAVRGHFDLTGEADFTGCAAANEAPMTMIYCGDERKREEVYRALKSRKGAAWRAYRREETPAHLRYRGNPRIGDIVILPKGEYLLQVLPPGDGEAKAVAPTLKGMHGYDPRRREMHGLLVGAGPAFKAGARLKEAENAGVYLLICKLLGLKPPAGLDATERMVKAFVRALPE
jgi:alkaline phosphatase D